MFKLFKDKKELTDEIKILKKQIDLHFKKAEKQLQESEKIEKELKEFKRKIKYDIKDMEERIKYLIDENIKLKNKSNIHLLKLDPVERLKLIHKGEIDAK